jgi:cell division protease FtsH
LEKEVIFKEDLERIFGKRPFKENFDQLGQEKSLGEAEQEENVGTEGTDPTTVNSSEADTKSDSSEEAEEAVEEKK